MDQVLQAIAEPRRRSILKLIRDQELASGDIAARFPEVTRPAISQHLKVLMEAGLITVRREGTRRLYHIRPEGLVEVREFLEQFWDENLLLLKQAAEAEEQTTGSKRASLS
jgi:DNA-binding transcriptional ArsR family regulator